MHREFHEKFAELLQAETAFVVATVLAVRGSAAAKPGAKAIINAEGRPVFGWVGGGCVESFVCTEAAEALREGSPRVVTADLEDELSGVGLPCGGMMDIFIEPIMPRRRLLVAGSSGALALEVAHLAQRVGFAVTLHAPLTEQTKVSPGVDRLIRAPLENIEIDDESLVIIIADETVDLNVLQSVLANAKPAYLALAVSPVEGNHERLLKDGLEKNAFENTVLHAGLDLGGQTDQELALSLIAELLAVRRGASCRPLQEVKRAGPPVSLSTAESSSPSQPNLVIVGHSSITEELAWLAIRLGWPISVDSASALSASYPEQARVVTFDTDFSKLPVDSQSSVVVASHHKGDHLAIAQALRGGAKYVGLVASAHRSALVRGMLPDSLAAGDAAALSCLRTPAGLDLGATSPAEIALSVMSEVLAVHYGRVGQPRCVPGKMKTVEENLAGTTSIS
ncbi:MAG TPA: XdhC family protein [Pyrinomonadaceae bacterium]|jgi:xanthine dehydrogenase accessory factor|nr:XdhC family protein [Pyrinomonadaceae bacterium]